MTKIKLTDEQKFENHLRKLNRVPYRLLLRALIRTPVPLDLKNPNALGYKIFAWQCCTAHLLESWEIQRAENNRRE